MPVAMSDLTKQIDDAVNKARYNNLFKVEYMSWNAALMDERREGREEGHEAGLKAGKDLGILGVKVLMFLAGFCACFAMLTGALVVLTQMSFLNTPIKIRKNDCSSIIRPRQKIKIRMICCICIISN